MEYGKKKEAVLLFQHAVPAALTLTKTDYHMKATRIMNKIIIYLSAVLLLCSCGSARHYAAFQYDNGDDYVSEGLYRLTSSSCHPKIFIKEFCNFLVPCHQHCLRVNVLVQR